MPEYGYPADAAENAGAIWGSYSGGVSGRQASRSRSTDEVEAAVNVSFKNGYACQRPSWNYCAEDLSGVDQQRFRFGIVQGLKYYKKASIWVAVIDGSIFGIDSKNCRVCNIDPVQGRSLSERVDKVWMEEHAGYLVVQDGKNHPVVLEGKTSAVNPFGIPIGTDMKSVANRLAVLSKNCKRLYFSNHRSNPLPEVHPLGFDEANEYFLNSPYIELPDEVGDGLALACLPLRGGSTVDSDNIGVGPLLVMGSNGTVSYDVRIP